MMEGGTIVDIDIVIVRSLTCSDIIDALDTALYSRSNGLCLYLHGKAQVEDNFSENMHSCSFLWKLGLNQEPRLTLSGLSLFDSCRDMKLPCLYTNLFCYDILLTDWHTDPKLAFQIVIGYCVSKNCNS